MKKNLLPLLSLLVTTLAFSQSKNYLDMPYVETSATVDTLVTPDKIYLNITIREKDSKGRKSVEEQENKMAQRLKALGIDLDKQLRIQDLSSDFKNYFLRGTEVLKSKAYTLVVYSGKQAAEVLQALEQLDIANTSLEKTEYSNMETLELQLKTKATTKARKKAEALTAPLGQKIGAALHIVDTSIPFHYTPYRQERMSLEKTMYESQPEPLDIDFEQIKVATTVHIKFKLLP